MATQLDAEIRIDTICPRFHHAVELIGRKWTGAILLALQMGRSRFTEIAAMVPGLSDRLLSERLKELEAEGIVRRIVTPETPVRIEYRLTEKGESLDTVMASISTWAEEWIELKVAQAACDKHAAAGNDCE